MFLLKVMKLEAGRALGIEYTGHSIAFLHFSAHRLRFVKRLHEYEYELLKI